jgi:hypothetical protein
LKRSNHVVKDALRIEINGSQKLRSTHQSHYVGLQLRWAPWQLVIQVLQITTTYLQKICPFKIADPTDRQNTESIKITDIRYISRFS